MFNRWHAIVQQPLNLLADKDAMVGQQCMVYKWRGSSYSRRSRNFSHFGARRGRLTNMAVAAFCKKLFLSRLKEAQWRQTALFGYLKI